MFNAGVLGTVSLAAAASYHEGKAGAQLHAGWEFSKGNFNLTASTKRSFGDYADLGIATAEDDFSDTMLNSVEQISLGYGFPDWKSGIGLSFIHSEYRDGTASNLVSANFSQQLLRDISFHASGFLDLNDRDSLGAQAGIHIPLGKRYSGAAGMQLDKDTVHAKSSIAKSLENQPGGYGWRVEYGDGEEHRLAASGQYVTSRNFISGNAYHQDGFNSANVGMDGALVVADGALFLSRRINSSFSVVDAGAPDVEVYSQNRLVGKTGKSGKILVPNIGPYQKNTIRIEADDLPLDAEIPETETQTVVARNSGSVVRFGVKRQTNSALVEFKLSDGSFAPPGSVLKLNGGEEEFIIGFDGQAYLSGLSAQNTTVLELEESNCVANFVYSAVESGQTFIEGVICQ